ncbi:MAG: hypothetical protein IH989_05725 [Planctomycetes bacterium]|nr:hypothetical protein [Planctomycetota bacterium]
MAKQMVGPLERHLEKAILAVAGILLIGSAAMYLVTSPNEIELGGETVTPSTIDAKLASRALSVREAIRRARSDSTDVESLAPGFESTLDPFQSGRIPLTLVSAGSIGPHVPVADPASAAPGQRSLVTVAPLGKPSVTSGRSTFTFFDDDGEAFSIANWVTVSAVFDVKEQTALQRAEYGASRKDVFFGLPQLQSRVQRTDGSWSDDDWQIVEPWPKLRLGPPPTVFLDGDGDEVTLDPTSAKNLGRYTKNLTEPLQQLDILRPFLPDILNGDGWSFPTLTSHRDVVVQDQEFLFPENPDADTLDRYNTGEASGIALGGGQAKLTFAERRKQHEEAYDRLIDSAQKNLSADDARRAYNEAQAIFTDIEAGAGDKNKAAKLMKAAEQAEFDIERRRKRGRRRAAAEVPAAGRGAAQTVRQTQPTQQMWVHDAGPGSVESGKTYQYRMRPTVLNGLAGDPQKFRDKQNAAVVLIAGAWTEPVEVVIPRDTMFFLTSKDKGKGTVKIQFYKWEEGVWVYSRRFAYSVGDDLNGESRCKLPSPDDPSRSYNALVDFEVDGTIVDIDFERTYRERKKVSSSRTGVKFATASRACSVVFVDAAGRLYERFVPTDKANPERKAMAGQVWTKK